MLLHTTCESQRKESPLNNSFLLVNTVACLHTGVQRGLSSEVPADEFAPPPEILLGNGEPELL